MPELTCGRRATLTEIPANASTRIWLMSGVEQSERWTNPGGDVARRLLENIETVVHGKREEIRLVLAALIGGGHVLFEDVPGTAKTVLARAIAASIEGVIPAR